MLKEWVFAKLSVAIIFKLLATSIVALPPILTKFFDTIDKSLAASIVELLEFVTLFNPSRYILFASRVAKFVLLKFPSVPDPDVTMLTSVASIVARVWLLKLFASIVRLPASIIALSATPATPAFSKSPNAIIVKLFAALRVEARLDVPVLLKPPPAVPIVSIVRLSALIVAPLPLLKAYAVISRLPVTIISLAVEVLLLKSPSILKFWSAAIVPLFW